MKVVWVGMFVGMGDGLIGGVGGALYIKNFAAMILAH